MRKLLLLIILICLFLPTQGSSATDYTQDANCLTAILMKSDENPLSDSSGNSATAALKGAGEPNYTTDAPSGYSAGSYDWDGTDDYAVIDDNSLDNLANYSTVQWVYVDSGGDSNYPRYWGKGVDDKNFWDDRDGAGNDGIVHSIPTDGTTRQSIDNVNVGTGSWIHLATTYASGNAPKIYVNGTEISYASQNNGTGSDRDDSDGGWYIGNRSSATRTLDGHITEFAVFSDVLSSVEINEIIDCGLDGSVCGRARRML